MKTLYLQQKGTLPGKTLSRQQQKAITGGDDPSALIRCFDGDHNYLGGIGHSDCPADKAEICSGQFPATIYCDCVPGGLE